MIGKEATDMKEAGANTGSIANTEETMMITGGANPIDMNADV